MEKVITTDPAACTGCRLCELACSLHLDPTARPAQARLAVIRLEERGVHVPEVCRHCAVPPCAVSCPVEALVRDEDTGAVVLVEEVCIGCRTCVQACPFGVIGVDPDRGTIIKCDLCGGEPACVSVCPTGALAFEAVSRYTGRLRLRRATGLADA